MKHYYYIAILLLLGGFGWAVKFNMDYQEPAKDKVVFETPTESTRQYPKIQEEKKLEFLNSVWDENLFSKNRGTVETSNNPSDDMIGHRNSTMELLGIFRFGGANGAVILVKGGSSISRRSVKGKPAQRTRPSKYYALGEKLPNGYVLDEVRSDSVLLVRGSEEAVLEIEFGDMSSQKRNQAGLAKSESLFGKKDAPETTKKPVRKPQGNNTAQTEEKMPADEAKRNAATQERLKSFRERLKLLRKNKELGRPR